MSIVSLVLVVFTLLILIVVGIVFYIIFRNISKRSHKPALAYPVLAICFIAFYVFAIAAAFNFISFSQDFELNTPTIIDRVEPASDNTDDLFE